MTKQLYSFNPDYVVAPGETLLETIEAFGMSQSELAERTGLTAKHINGIIKGRAAITPRTALQFERVLGVPATFWNNLEANYREKLAELEEREQLESEVNWLKQLPLKVLLDRGWIKKGSDNAEQVKNALNFFGCATVDAWKEYWQKLFYSQEVVFRKSTAYESEVGAVAAWLRQGELQAHDIKCKPYNTSAFKQALKKIRLLTTQPPEIFVPQMIELCADAGVCVVFVPEIPKCRVNGATRWISPNKALIQLSLRYKTDDHLWFTFFHEAGHILLHGKKGYFLEGVNNDGDQEEEANKFAADFLMPPDKYTDLLEGNISRAKIVAFANELRIAPGIIVGRLQHDRYVKFSYFNDLKVRLKWSEDE
ncbi:addiction module antidote protein, HigA family [Brevibacillus borstelensis]|uniref:HigA family addiction module antitoxin n=1 Tax=Brevibacillus borstelensis TaxID=45462 RepID=UPI000F07D137|nr:HigA family addiction module antitoxin [Brevibacillus borstelensis]MED1881049.1 HigA family addiction module antitoxin [Brevibacillus borstelensis]RNB66419.1 addiction module antidote protein, HigA family [Brevibacillus borstelensis]GED53726.1 XRE family transcriptional regulator [Brevibacillus borstelensis]